MGNPEPEQEIVEHKVCRAVAINALRKIGAIVAEEQQADEEKAVAQRWLLRYGWLVALASCWHGRIGRG
jgi:hypothetical protein